MFQLQPQQWTVAAGHALKLELLTQDDGTNNQPGAMTPGAYARNASGQAAVSVSNLSLRVPTRTAPTGNITAPAAPVLPAGYQLARDLVTPTPTATVSPTPTATSSYYGIPTATPTPYVITPVTTKKKPGLTAKVRPKRDRRRPFKFKVTGKLKRPSGVSKSAGCKGKIKITVRKGKKVLAKKTTKVKSSCKYVKKNIRLKAKKAGRKGKAKFTISFRGNAKLKVKTIKRSARYGRK